MLLLFLPVPGGAGIMTVTMLFDNLLYVTKNTKMKLLIPNKKLNFNYFVEDKYEAGISLKGSEVKSLANI